MSILDALQPTRIISHTDRYRSDPFFPCSTVRPSSEAVLKFHGPPARRGVGVLEDLEEAAKWFQRSADRLCLQNVVESHCKGEIDSFQTNSTSHAAHPNRIATTAAGAFSQATLSWAS